MAYTQFRERFPNTPSLANAASVAILVTGVGYYLRSHIKQSWKMAVKDITPRDIKNSASFTTYYIKESAKDKKEAMRKIFRKMAQKITKRATKEIPVRQHLENKKTSENKNDLR